MTGPCPCGGGAYGDCCGRFHRGDAHAPTAAALMRSRYSAFAVGDAAYLLRTWHPSTRPTTLRLDDDIRWVGLDVRETFGGGVFDRAGIVEFAAHYEAGGRRAVQQERSTFVREDGRWYYVAAE